MRLLLALVLLAPPTPDADQDGLADALEQTLLAQFAPRFLISPHDCDGKPAEFEPDRPAPAVKARNGVIYTQAFPLPGGIELHYYHLWARDCGRNGHALDPEHVSVFLIEDQGQWRARYHYAAAHEDTACDRGTAVRASTQFAEWRGVEVWISHGKHASFLSPDHCGRLGCGSDRCDKPDRLLVPRLINLGEPGRPLHGSVWAASPLWPLAARMQSDFPPSLRAQLDQSPGVILAVTPNYVAQPVALAASKTLDSLSLANKKTESALIKAKRWVKKRLD